MRYLPIALGASLLCFAANISAQDASLFSPAAAIVDYDPFEGLAGIEDIILEAQNSGTSPLNARLVITPDTSNVFEFTGPNSPVSFEIDSAYGNSNANQFDVPITLPPSSSPHPITLTFKVPSGQYADAGDQNIDLKIALLDSATSEPLSNEKIINLIGRTPLRAQTNFAGTSAGFENGSTYALVDFGEIISGDSRRVNFQIRGNSDVDISMSSENGGKLINQDAPTMSPIAYAVNADGVHSDLSAPIEFTRRPARNLSGTSYPLEITLDNAAIGAYAGSYKDIITIDVTPR